MEQLYSSQLFQSAVDEFAKLPGVGRKSALRLVLHLLRQEEQMVAKFSSTIMNMRSNIHYCKCCHNISDEDICEICSDKKRDKSIICVVENIQDVMAIEATMQYQGLYHVLGGVISPMDGVGPQDLAIDRLIERLNEGGVTEVILALSSTMEGDTTSFFISRKLAAYPEVLLTTLSRGMSVNDELQYTDEVTLGKSILNRVKFQ